jgi:hypothetical protein
MTAKLIMAARQPKWGRDHIPAIIVRMTNDEARLWEIAENLHRADLTRRAGCGMDFNYGKTSCGAICTASQGGQQPGGTSGRCARTWC